MTLPFILATLARAFQLLAPSSLSSDRLSTVLAAPPCLLLAPRSPQRPRRWFLLRVLALSRSSPSSLWGRLLLARPPSIGRSGPCLPRPYFLADRCGSHWRCAQPFGESVFLHASTELFIHFMVSSLYSRLLRVTVSVLCGSTVHYSIHLYISITCLSIGFFCSLLPF